MIPLTAFCVMNKCIYYGDTWHVN